MELEIGKLYRVKHRIKVYLLKHLDGNEFEVSDTSDFKNPRRVEFPEDNRVELIDLLSESQGRQVSIEEPILEYVGPTDGGKHEFRKTAKSLALIVVSRDLIFPAKVLVPPAQNAPVPTTVLVTTTTTSNDDDEMTLPLTMEQESLVADLQALVVEYEDEKHDSQVVAAARTRLNAKNGGHDELVLLQKTIQQNENEKWFCPYKHLIGKAMKAVKYRIVLARGLEKRLLLEKAVLDAKLDLSEIARNVLLEYVRCVPEDWNAMTFQNEFFEEVQFLFGLYPDMHHVATQQALLSFVQRFMIVSEKDCPLDEALTGDRNFMMMNMPADDFVSKHQVLQVDGQNHIFWRSFLVEFYDKLKGVNENSFHLPEIELFEDVKSFDEDEDDELARYIAFWTVLDNRVEMQSKFDDYDYREDANSGKDANATPVPQQPLSPPTPAKRVVEVLSTKEIEDMLRQYVKNKSRQGRSNENLAKDFVNLHGDRIPGKKKEAVVLEIINRIRSGPVLTSVFDEKKKEEEEPKKKEEQEKEDVTFTWPHKRQIDKFKRDKLSDNLVIAETVLLRAIQDDENFKVDWNSDSVDYIYQKFVNTGPFYKWQFAEGREWAPVLRRVIETVKKQQQPQWQQKVDEMLDKYYSTNTLRKSTFYNAFPDVDKEALKKRIYEFSDASAKKAADFYDRVISGKAKLEDYATADIATSDKEFVRRLLLGEYEALEKEYFETELAKKLMTFVRQKKRNKKIDWKQRVKELVKEHAREWSIGLETEENYWNAFTAEEQSQLNNKDEVIEFAEKELEAYEERADAILREIETGSKHVDISGLGKKDQQILRELVSIYTQEDADKFVAKYKNVWENATDNVAIFIVKQTWEDIVFKFVKDNYWRATPENLLAELRAKNIKDAPRDDDDAVIMKLIRTTYKTTKDAYQTCMTTLREDPETTIEDAISIFGDSLSSHDIGSLQLMNNAIQEASSLRDFNALIRTEYADTKLSDAERELALTRFQLRLEKVIIPTKAALLAELEKRSPNVTYEDFAKTSGPMFFNFSRALLLDILRHDMDEALREAKAMYWKLDEVLDMMQKRRHRSFYEHFRDVLEEHFRAHFRAAHLDAFRKYLEAKTFVSLAAARADLRAKFPQWAITEYWKDIEKYIRIIKENDGDDVVLYSDNDEKDDDNNNNKRRRAPDDDDDEDQDELIFDLNVAPSSASLKRLQQQSSSSSSSDNNSSTPRKRDGKLPDGATWLDKQAGNVFKQGYFVYRIIKADTRKDVDRRPQFYVDNPSLTVSAELVTVVGRNGETYDALKMPFMAGYVTLKHYLDSNPALDNDHRDRLAKALADAYSRLKYATYQDVVNLRNIAVAERPTSYRIMFYEGGREDDEGKRTVMTPAETARWYLSRLENESGGQIPVIAKIALEKFITTATVSHYLPPQHCKLELTVQGTTRTFIFDPEYYLPQHKDEPVRVTNERWLNRWQQADKIVYGGCEISHFNRDFSACIMQRNNKELPVLQQQRLRLQDDTTPKENIFYAPFVNSKMTGKDTFMTIQQFGERITSDGKLASLDDTGNLIIKDDLDHYIAPEEEARIRAEFKEEADAEITRLRQKAEEARKVDLLRTVKGATISWTLQQLTNANAMEVGQKHAKSKSKMTGQTWYINKEKQLLLTKLVVSGSAATRRVVGNGPPTQMVWYEKGASPSKTLFPKQLALPKESDDDYHEKRMEWRAHGLKKEEVGEPIPYLRRKRVQYSLVDPEDLNAFQVDENWWLVSRLEYEFSISGSTSLHYCKDLLPLEGCAMVNGNCVVNLNEGKVKFGSLAYVQRKSINAPFVVTIVFNDEKDELVAIYVRYNASPEGGEAEQKRQRLEGALAAYYQI
jgi:hypothetical protein